MQIIPLTRAKATLSELIARLLYRKEAVVITRKRTPVAAIVPYDEWVRTQSSSSADDGLAAAAGALADLDHEVDTMVEAAYAARASAKDRPVRL